MLNRFGIYTREKYLCKNFGGKKWGGSLLKGGVYSRELTVLVWMVSDFANETGSN